MGINEGHTQRPQTEGAQLMEKFYTLKNAAVKLADQGIPYKSEYIRKLVHRGEIKPTTRMMQGGSSPILIPESALDSFIKRRLTILKKVS